MCGLVKTTSVILSRLSLGCLRKQDFLLFSLLSICVSHAIDDIIYVDPSYQCFLDDVGVIGYVHGFAHSSYSGILVSNFIPQNVAVLRIQQTISFSFESLADIKGLMSWLRTIFLAGYKGVECCEYA